MAGLLRILECYEYGSPTFMKHNLIRHYIVGVARVKGMHYIHKFFCGWFNFIIFVFNLNPPEFPSNAKYHPQTIFPWTFCLHYQTDQYTNY